MSAPSTACSVQGCKRISRSLCYCCQRNLCREHLKEHDDLLNSQLSPLVDDVNVLADRLQQINITKLIAEGKAELDKWRREEYRNIDQLYEQKCADIERHIYEQYEEQKHCVKNLKKSVAEHIRAQDASDEIIDTLYTAIQEAKQNLSTFGQQRNNVIMRSSDSKLNTSNKQKMSELDINRIVPIPTHISSHGIPSTNNESNARLIQSEPQPFFDISIIPNPYKTHKISPWSVFASNGQHLIVYEYDHFSVYDKQLNLIKKGLVSLIII